MKAGGARSKAIGSYYEAEIAKRLQSVFGPSVRRGEQRDPAFACPDVDGTAFWIETKRGRRVNLKAALRQAERDWRTRGLGYRFPMVIARDDFEQDVVLMRLDHLLDLLTRRLEAAGGIR